MYHHDTIAAIATPVGAGGIGIIKISGPDSLKIANTLFCSPALNSLPLASHRVYHGTIVDPQDSTVIDEVLITCMHAPRSYTRENVVEINCHSGIMVLQKILSLVMQCGARPAEPGEFTKRAFLNGRIDLTQAEAVIDIIEAKTESSLKISSSQLRGRLSNALHALRDELIDITAHIDAAIDFPDEDIDPVDARTMEFRLAGAAEKLQSLSATYHEGKMYRLGVKTTIVGKPNVGKSSLLNALLGEDRALVTAVPGTTRDVIQETISVCGIPLVLQDTAGLHAGSDEIEKLGMKLTRTRLAEAELVLLVIDGSHELDERDHAIMAELHNQRVIAVINKEDIAQAVKIEQIQQLLPCPAASVSAKNGSGLDRLRELIRHTVLRFPCDSSADIIITSARQQDALDRTARAVSAARQAISSSHAPELIAVDLRDALLALGEITGETATEDILERIFTSFCIGK
jgi:tRNA modification GTPase